DRLGNTDRHTAYRAGHLRDAGEVDGDEMVDAQGDAERRRDRLDRGPGTAGPGYLDGLVDLRVFPRFGFCAVGLLARGDVDQRVARDADEDRALTVGRQVGDDRGVGQVLRLTGSAGVVLGVLAEPVVDPHQQDVDRLAGLLRLVRAGGLIG